MKDRQSLAAQERALFLAQIGGFRRDAELARAAIVRLSKETRAKLARKASVAEIAVWYGRTLRAAAAMLLDYIRETGAYGRLAAPEYVEKTALAHHDGNVEVVYTRNLILASGLFSERVYLQLHEDVAAAGLDPLDHFLYHGGLEGRSPGTDFDVTRYLAVNGDVAAAGMNPLVHFLRCGVLEGRGFDCLPGVLPDVPVARLKT